MSKRFWVATLLVAALAAGLRLAHVREVTSQPLYGTLVQDALFYHERAAGLAPDEAFMHVGYPHFVSAVYSVSGPHPAAVLVLQCVLGAGTTVLIALAALWLLGDRVVAVVAAALYAVYRGAIFYDGLLLTPATTNFVVAVALAGAARHARAGGRSALWIAGAAAGTAVLLRSNQIFLVPLLALGVAASAPAVPHVVSMRERIRWGATVLLAAIVVFGPVVVYRGFAHATWTLTANGGMNFWVGNNRNAEGVYFEAPFLERLDAAGELEGFVEEARRLTRDPGLTLAGASDYWFRAGLAEIGDDRTRWLRIQARKLALFWNAFETKTNVGLAFVRGFSFPLDRLSLGFGVLAVFGLTGAVVVLLAPLRRALVLLTAFVLAPLLTCVLFFVSGEYRHPVTIPLAVLAAAAVATLARALVSGRRRVALGIALGPVAFSAAAFYPFPVLSRTFHPALDYATHAKVLARDGGADRAVELLAHGGETLRDNLFVVEARLSVLAEAALRGDREAAVGALDAAADLLSRNLEPGQAAYPDRFLRGLFGWTEARVARLARSPVVVGDRGLENAAALLGGNGYRELASAYARGDHEEVLRFADAARARAGAHPVPLAWRGRSLIALGRTEEGLAALRESLNGWPRVREPASFLEEHFSRTGDLERARVAAEEARRRGSPGPN